MNEQEWNLKNLVIGKITEFGKVHPVRNEIFEEIQDRTERDDGKRLAMIKYSGEDMKETGFYGVLSEKDCHCRCGAGHLNLAVLHLEQLKDIPETARDIDRYMSNRHNQYGRGSEFAQNILFEILTGRAGNRTMGSWNSIYEISGLEIPYNSGRLLIRDLSQIIENVRTAR